MRDRVLRDNVACLSVSVVCDKVVCVCVFVPDNVLFGCGRAVCVCE